MAHNEYYTFNQGAVNGEVSMNVHVFDTIVKETVSKMENVDLDASKGFSIPGTKAHVSCSIKDNEVFIEIHVKIKYGVKVSKTSQEIQEKICSAILEMTGVKVNCINVIVDEIIFE
jgi:uncharacterized alkaline shock family protein YloU